VPDRVAPTKRPWLETLRLSLREFARDEVAEIHRLDRDPRVMRYVADGKPKTRADAGATMGRIQRYYRINYGLGVWRASRRDTGAYIGWFAMNYCPPTCDIEVGYRLLPDAWGHGFATEGATELVRYGFEDLGIEKIIGVTHLDNRASQRVLMKAGLEDRGFARYYGRRMRYFVAER
jgi:RimJ/RimL family protein N-acetyltransferase